MKPYKTEPVLVERIWGGSRLCGYNKRINKGNIGESWETGPIKEDIPLLIKLIDARDMLSVQVHPDDESALKLEKAGRGKTEAWIVLDCEEESFIIYGFKRHVRREELIGFIEEGSLSEVLNQIKVRKGDCIYIPAGMVHSLGKGILAYEVQQPSDLTYRIYDWDRKDSLGRKRELHIDKALEAINYSIVPAPVINIYDLSGDRQNTPISPAVSCRYFEICFGSLAYGETHFYGPGRFRAFTVISGSLMLRFEDSQIRAVKGDTLIIPGEYQRVAGLEGLETAEYIVAACNT